MRCSQVSYVDMILYLGVSLNGGTPISHPKMIVFFKENPWLLDTTILGNPHLMLNSEFMNNDMEQVDQCGGFFTYIAAWDTSYIPDGVDRTWLDFSNVNRTCGLIVAKQASCLEMRCISCYRSSLLPRYLNDLCGSCCIFSTTCFHLFEARSVVHRWNITFPNVLGISGIGNGVSFHFLEAMIFDLTIDREIDL